MRLYSIMALCRKELFSSFFSPVFYGTGAFFLLFVSIWLYYLQAFFAMDTASLRPFFSAFPFAYILIIPAITMKSWAEEKKTGTAELLYSLPLSLWELSLGKFLSSFIVLCIYIFLTVPVPLSILPLARFDLGVIVTEYTGAVLLGASIISLGLFFSALSKSQAAAFLGSAMVLLALMLIDRLNMSFNLPAGFSRFLYFFSLTFHFESFSRGLLDSRDIAFFVLASILFLFLSTRILIFRKWS